MTIDEAYKAIIAADGNPDREMIIKITLDVLVKKERENIPLGHLRQFINERTPQESKNLLTNEDIMKFIRIGYRTSKDD